MSAAGRHWQWNASRSRFAAWFGRDRTFSLAVRVAISRGSVIVSVALGPFYAGVGVP